MMKRVTLLLALTLSYCTFAATPIVDDICIDAKPIQSAPSNITAVTVYLSGAQVIRNASIQTKPGTSIFKFENLSPYIDENSIQVSGLDNAAILSINYGLDFLRTPKFPKKVDSLKKRIKTLRIQQQRISSTIDGLQKEEDVLNTNKRLGSETVEIDLSKVKEMATYYRNRLTELRNERIDAQFEKQEIIEEISSIEKQFKEYNVTDEVQKGIITLKLNTASVSNLDLKISYTVSEAGWFPMYDLRAETVNEPLDLHYKSHVYQKTGVDWKNIDLVLSTGDPNTDNNKPQVDPKYLNFVNRYSYKAPRRAKKAYNYKYNPNVRKVSGIVYDDAGLPLPGANIIVKGTAIGTQTDFDGKYSLEIQDGSELEFSYVGFISEIVPVHASQINMNLDADNQLDEVVIVAQGVRREKKALGYAVSEVDSELLTGQTSGIQINGSPGATSNIVIRGQNSIDASNQALYIIDGVPYDGNQISEEAYLDLSSDNISNVNVLKGAAAKSLYGSKGRNGVIVITTKNGTATGQLKIDAITTTRFEIQTPYSIPSDGDVTIIEVDSFSVPATYEYFAAPLLNENVFLTAQIKDWEKFSLLPGEANIYFEGSFAGKTYINPLATTEALTISLGVDPNVIVKRKQNDNFKDRSFIGNTRIVTNTYSINIKNNKNKAIALTLVDRVPISQNKEIKIVDIETPHAVFNEKTGIATWKLNLKPKDTKEEKISYTVRYPKSKSINL